MPAAGLEKQWPNLKKQLTFNFEETTLFVKLLDNQKLINDGGSIGGFRSRVHGKYLFSEIYYVIEIVYSL